MPQPPPPPDTQGHIWLQVAILLGYPPTMVRRAAHSAIVCGLSASQHDSAQIVRFMYHILPHLHTQRWCILFRCLRWLQHHAFWLGDHYSSWALPGHLRPDDVSGAWCSDWAALEHHRHDICLARHGCATPVCVCVCMSKWLHVSPRSTYLIPVCPPPGDRHVCFLTPPCFLCTPKAKHYTPPALGFHNDEIGQRDLLLPPRFRVARALG